MSTNLNVEGIWVSIENTLMFSSTATGTGNVVGGSWGTSGQIILKNGTNNTFTLTSIGGDDLVFEGDSVGSKAKWGQTIFVCSSKVLPDKSTASGTQGLGFLATVERDDYCSKINRNDTWICDAENFEKKCPKKSTVKGWTKKSADILISHPVKMPLSVIFQQSQNLCPYIKEDLQPKFPQGQKILDVKGIWVGIQYSFIFSSTEKGIGKILGGSWGATGGIILKDGTNNTFTLTIGGDGMVFDGDSVGSKAKWGGQIFVCSSKIIPDTSTSVEQDDYCTKINDNDKWICDAENFEKKCPIKASVKGWTKKSADILISHPVEMSSDIIFLQSQNLCPYVKADFQPKPPQGQKILDVEGIWVGIDPNMEKFSFIFSSTADGKGKILGGSWSSGGMILKNGTNNTFTLTIGGDIVFEGDSVGSKATWNRLLLVCSSKIIPDKSSAVENDTYCNNINSSAKWICDADNFEIKCPKKSNAEGWTTKSADILISHPIVMPLSVQNLKSQNLCAYIDKPKNTTVSTDQNTTTSTNQNTTYILIAVGIILLIIAAIYYFRTRT